MVYLSNKILYKIILSFGHCFAKINRGGGWIRVDEIFEN